MTKQQKQHKTAVASQNGDKNDKLRGSSWIARRAHALQAASCYNPKTLYAVFRRHGQEDPFDPVWQNERYFQTLGGAMGAIGEQLQDGSKQYDIDKYTISHVERVATVKTEDRSVAQGESMEAKHL
jgi:hypothetical protein